MHIYTFLCSEWPISWTSRILIFPPGITCIATASTAKSTKHRTVRPSENYCTGMNIRHIVLTFFSYLNISQPPNLEFSRCLAFLSFRCHQFLPVFTHGKVFYGCCIQTCAEKIANHADYRKYTVNEACIHGRSGIKMKLFSSLTNRKSFFWTKGKGEILTMMPLNFKDLQNKILSNP
jgi:hypothetical protein